jgi:hypothetical protein
MATNITHRVMFVAISHIPTITLDKVCYGSV